jgi:hypothetical protein
MGRNVRQSVNLEKEKPVNRSGNDPESGTKEKSESGNFKNRIHSGNQWKNPIL